MAKKKATENSKIEQIICAEGTPDGLFLVQSTWFESDSINAVGQVLRNDWARGSRFDCALNTNDGLSCIWSSPDNNLWLASGRGNVYSTAEVKFPAHRMDNLDYDAADSSFDWKVTTLPDMRTHGYRPNVTALWGTSDCQVFAGTFKGGIYQWNGEEWKQSFWETASTINRIHGTGPDNVYAVGRDGTVLHFDGSRWRQIPYVNDNNQGRNLTGVLALTKDETLVVGTDGRLLQVNPNEMSILAEFEVGFYGIGRVGQEMLLAGGDAGVFRLEGNKISNMKNTFGAVGIFEVEPKLLITEPSQNPASIIEYDPADKQPWWRRTF